MNREKKDINCTIVILSFNTKLITDKCLRLAEKSATFCEKKMKNVVNIICVDNGSSDGSAEFIKKHHPKIQLIALSKNVGFGKGNNLAMKITKTGYSLLLNSDAFLRKETIYNSISFLEKNPKYDAFSCKFLFPDNSFQASAGFLPTPFKTIRWAFGIESLPILKKLIHPIYQYNKNFYKKEKPIEWCPFAFFFFRKKVFDLTKGFDEKLFLYMEDVEWCMRIKKRGLLIGFTPRFSVTHIGGFSSKKLPSADVLKRHIEGLMYYHKIHFPRSFAIIKFCCKTGFLARSVFYYLFSQKQKAYEYRQAARIAF